MSRTPGSSTIGAGLSVVAGLVAVLVGAGVLVHSVLAAPPTATSFLATAVAGSDGGIAGVNPEATGVDDGEKKQAAGVPMRVERPGRIPEDRIGSGVTGGCVLGYGKGKLCLPTVPPGERAHAGHAGVADLASRWTCSQVWLLFPKGIAVNSSRDGVGSDGVDPLGLDTNEDGVACGSGDRD
jgi:hypothetical protein